MSLKVVMRHYIIENLFYDWLMNTLIKLNPETISKAIIILLSAFWKMIAFHIEKLSIRWYY